MNTPLNNVHSLVTMLSHLKIRREVESLWIWHNTDAREIDQEGTQENAFSDQQLLINLSFVFPQLIICNFERKVFNTGVALNQNSQFHSRRLARQLVETKVKKVFPCLQSAPPREGNAWWFQNSFFETEKSSIPFLRD